MPIDNQGRVRFTRDTAEPSMVDANDLANTRAAAKVVQEIIGELPMDSITRDDIRGVIRRLCALGYPATETLWIFTIMGDIFDSAVEKKIIKESPVKDLDLPYWDDPESPIPVLPS